MNWIPRSERCRREMIRQACLERGWRFLDPPLSGQSPNERLVVGLAMWSGYDVDFFVRLQRSSLLDQLPLEVFDMEDVRTEADFQQFIPGGHLPLRTPVMGVIRNGSLAEQVEGDIVLAMSPPDLMRLLKVPREP